MCVLCESSVNLNANNIIGKDSGRYYEQMYEMYGGYTAS